MLPSRKKKTEAGDFANTTRPLIFDDGTIIRHPLHKTLKDILYRPGAKARHLLKAKRANGGGIHSPFLYRFVTVVLEDRWPYYVFENLCDSGKRQRVRPRRFRILRFGRRHDPERINRLLFRMVHDLRPDVMAVSRLTDSKVTLYLEKACPKATFIGSTFLPENSRPTPTRPSSKMIQVDPKQLAAELALHGPTGFVLLDGFESAAQRLSDYGSCTGNLHGQAVMVLKHIHGDPEQSAAWKRLRKNPEVRASIDLFDLGILFFRQDLPPSHLKIRL